VSLGLCSRSLAVVALLLATDSAFAEQTAEQVATMAQPPAVTRWGTGFFVNQDGDVVTARHVVEGCKAVSITKDGQNARAIIRSVSGNLDLAALRSSIKPLRAATFGMTAPLKRGQPIFTASYAVLRRMPDARTALFNGFLHAAASADASQFTISSQADHGSSGSPVLDAEGLVIGLVDERVSLYGTMIGWENTSPSDSFVVALSDQAIKSFLASGGIAFVESNRAQVMPLQSHALYAAAISVAVVCS
jgi:serine protease Do